MSETTPETTDPESEIPRGDRTVTLRRRDIDALEAKAARAEAAERKIAFAEAGLDLSDKKLSYFVRGYDGALDTESIRQAALDAGFITAAPSQTAEQVSSAQAAAQVTAASAGVTPPADAATQRSDYTTAFEQAMKTGDWEGFNNTVAKYGPVVGINIPN